MRLSAVPLSSARLVLEPLRVDHAAELAQVLDDESLHEFTGGQPLTEPELTKRFAAQVAEVSPDGSEVWLNWVVRFGEQAIGYVQATVAVVSQRITADIAWVVATPWQGQGFAKEASRAVVDWLAQAGVTGLAANIHPQHGASEAVARSLGMEPTNEVIDGERRWAKG